MLPREDLPRLLRPDSSMPRAVSASGPAARRFSAWRPRSWRGASRARSRLHRDRGEPCRIMDGHIVRRLGAAATRPLRLGRSWIARATAPATGCAPAPTKRIAAQLQVSPPSGFFRRDPLRQRHCPPAPECAEGAPALSSRDDHRPTRDRGRPGASRTLRRGTHAQHHTADPGASFRWSIPRPGTGVSPVSPGLEPEQPGAWWREKRRPGGRVHLCRPGTHQLDGVARAVWRGAGHLRRRGGAAPGRSGRALMRAAIEWIRSQGRSQVVLLTKTQNQHAQHLFAALGFDRAMGRDDAGPGPGGDHG